MKNLIQIIKSINLKQVLTVFLAGCLLTITIACSQGTVAQAESEVKSAMSDTYDQYDANQDFQGGMNGYNDDRRYDAETAAKAKGLVDTANNRQEDNIGDYAENILDRAVDKIDEAKREIPRTVTSNAKDAAEYLDNKSDKLQRNLSKAPQEAKEVFEGAKATAQNAIEDATQASKTTAKEIKGNFEDFS
ncbi:MAG: DUF6658 family protein [Cyanobacteria bacterium J06600_6]